MRRQIQRLAVSQQDLIDVGSHLRKHCIYYVSGSYSIFIPSTGVKYLNETALKTWPSLEGERIRMLPGEAARTELKREFPDLKRVGWPAMQMTLLGKQVPMYFSGSQIGEMIQIDLAGAYHQLYRLLWLDVSWPMGYYGQYPLKNVANRLADWKLARNALVGIARSTTTMGVLGERYTKLRTTNPYLSPPLWATLQDILHFIAFQAIEEGAIYVNVDGYIFLRQETGHERFTGFLRDLGLSYRIEGAGLGEIKAWNSYAVGKKSTKPYRLGLQTFSKEFTNVQKPKYQGWGHYLRRCRSIVGFAPNTQS